MGNITSGASSTCIWHEICEQPAAIQRALAGTLPVITQVAQMVRQREIDLIVLVARGTSDHAALYAQYVFQYLNGIPVALGTPSIVTLYGARLRLSRALVIGISQSGAAPDVSAVLEHARKEGALTLGITNVEGSLLASTAEYTLYCDAGQELSVAATKTYTTTCAILMQLSAHLPGGEPLTPYLACVPDLVAVALRSEPLVQAGVLRYVHARDCVVLGRVFDYCTARETALKLSETCYLVAIPFSTADFQHGPAALVEYGRPVILYAPSGRTLADSHELLKLLNKQGADSIVIAEDARLLELATTPIPLQVPLPTDQITGREASVPIAVAELLAPLPSIVYGQFLALHLSLSKGLNPDTPRGLSKVTRTL
ncbi:MAG TPA: SIS domain-containing protein [Ktedonobacteraceae bacterium]|jgi:glucosamine--fructose-6-phosphate aminotransferase (isomerizing)